MFWKSLTVASGALIVFLICTFFVVHAHAAAYTILDLGTLPAGYDTAGYALNDLGQVVGGTRYRTTRPPAHAFRTDPNSAISSSSDLGTLGGSYSIAAGINNLGQAVGNSYIAGDASFHAFRTQPNGPITATSDLGTYGGGNLSYAYNIHDSGQVVGFAYLAGNLKTRAFRTTPNGSFDAASDLGFLPGDDSSVAAGINASGQAVGWSGPNGNVFGDGAHAFRTEPNGPITAAGDLGTLGGDISRATGINASGQVCGLSLTQTSGYHFHAFRYDGIPGSGGVMQDLGTFGGSFSEAHSINTFGQIVGNAALAADADVHAALAEMNGALQDLNNLIPLNSGWDLNDATGINDLGEISGWGSIGGQTHGFLLTPTPEPANAAFAGTSFFFLARRRRRARH